MSVILIKLSKKKKECHILSLTIGAYEESQMLHRSTTQKKEFKYYGQRSTGFVGKASKALIMPLVLKVRLSSTVSSIYMKLMHSLKVLYVEKKGGSFLNFIWLQNLLHQCRPIGTSFPHPYPCACYSYFLFLIVVNSLACLQEIRTFNFYTAIVTKRKEFT